MVSIRKPSPCSQLGGRFPDDAGVNAKECQSQRWGVGESECESKGQSNGQSEGESES